MKPKFVSRKTLARYAAALGRDSLAACALRYFDTCDGARIEMRNNGFAIHVNGGIAHYDR